MKITVILGGLQKWLTDGPSVSAFSSIHSPVLLQCYSHRVVGSSDRVA
jgi:hypothetical protein